MSPAERYQRKLENEEAEADKVKVRANARTGKKFRVPTNAEQLELLERATYKRAKPGFFKARDYSRRQAKGLMAMNPWAGDLWAGILAEAYDEVGPQGDVFCITLVDADFDEELPSYGSSDITNLVTDRLPGLAKIVRNRLRGIAFLVQLDVAVHRLPRDHHQRLCLHFHGLAWGPTKKIEKALAIFPDGFLGAKGGRKSKAYNLPGWLIYMAKDTRCRYVDIPPTPGNAQGTFRHRESLHGPQRLMMLKMFDDWAKPELCIGSGVGAEILKAARRIAQDRGYVPFDGNRVSPRQNDG